MNADEFSPIFDGEIRHPLSAAGFRSYGKSLFLVEDSGCLSLIRLGGRMTSPGQISFVLCFRHTFLRTLEEKVPKGFVSEVHAHPYKLLLADFRDARSLPEYRARNLAYEWDRLPYDGVPVSMLRRQLGEVRFTILERAVPWARALSPRRANDEIRKHGEEAWIERIWLQDYEKFLAATPRDH